MGAPVIMLGGWSLEHRCCAPPNPGTQPTGRGGPELLGAPRSQWPFRGSVNLCGRGLEGLQLMRKSLGRSTRIPSEHEFTGVAF